MGVPVSVQDGLRKFKKGVLPAVDNAAAPAITVCICTRDRKNYLGPTLEAVLAQDYPREKFAVLVVDNGSADGTAEMVAARFSRNTAVPVRYVHEGMPGLSRARNRAVAETSSEAIVFLDDDAIPEPEWLRYLADAFSSAPDVVAVGGAVVPMFEGGKPTWARDINKYFSPMIPGDGLRRTSHPYLPWGGNMIYRRSAFQAIGTFREELGYRGSNLVTCEDIEWLMRVEKSGGGILFEPRAAVHHYISADRTTKKYLRRRTYGSGIGVHGLEKTRRSDFEEWGFREIGLAIVGLNFKRVGLWLKMLAVKLTFSVDGFDRELDCWRALEGIRARLVEAWRQLGRRLWRTRGGLGQA